MYDIQPCNSEALKRALEAVSGTEVAKITIAAYQAIDQAMKFGYDAGIAAGEADRAAAAKEYTEALDRALADAPSLNEQAQAAYDLSLIHI